MIASGVLHFTLWHLPTAARQIPKCKMCIQISGAGHVGWLDLHHHSMAGWHAASTMHARPRAVAPRGGAKQYQVEITGFVPP